ncbi:MAG: LTA synthase family protein [Bacteroidaceae bacterium]|nr:LTA synthase family protein [Bacteroidaceae bacterium]
MRSIIKSSGVCLIINLLWVYVCYTLCRFVFLLEHWSVFAGKLSTSSLLEMLKGGFMFDTSAILYTNVLVAFLLLLPLHWKETLTFHKICRWIYVAVNTLCLAINLGDVVYFTYTGRRTTASVFQEFGNEGNLGKIVGLEFMNHWYLVLLAGLMVYGLYRLYRMPDFRINRQRLVPYYIRQSVALLLFVPLCICGMRGGATTAVRPITISNANQYADSPQGAAVVLNTPFSLLRTIGKNAFVDPKFYSEEELAALYSPVHEFKNSEEKRKNVVVLIVESFGREYIGALNRTLEDGKYKGYTPFVDSLLTHAVTWEYSFCNGRKSIDGMPSILSSIPMFVEPFFLTPSSTNDISGLAGELGKKGYYSAFFHGAENGSMGFQAFARATGFKDYFGRTEYNEDKRFGGDKDFDGTWAIWDEPFLQFMATKMGEFQEPFVSAVFTASSHHPYAIPQEYKDIYPEEGIAIHKCIRYTDHALKLFFEKAKTQPWYPNTLFVLTSDHTNLSDHAEYQTDLGLFSSPVILFDPSGDLEPGIREGIAQQIDILPTVLGFLGYDVPFVGFGIDLLNTPASETWAVNYQNGIYQLVKGTYVIQHDGQQLRAVYDYRNDPLLKHNLKGSVREEETLETQLKAIIQSYMNRMLTNRLVEK